MLNSRQVSPFSMAPFGTQITANPFCCIACRLLTSTTSLCWVFMWLASRHRWHYEKSLTELARHTSCHCHNNILIVITQHVYMNLDMARTIYSKLFKTNILKNIHRKRKKICKIFNLHLTNLKFTKIASDLRKKCNLTGMQLDFACQSIL